jgi:hypothetical protein
LSLPWLDGRSWIQSVEWHRQRNCAWLLIAGDWQTNHTHTKHDYSHLA